MKLEEYNRIAESIHGGLPDYRGAVITVHGMNTWGPWQKHISPVLQDHSIRHIPVDYGYRILRVVRPLTNGLIQLVVERIVAAYANHQQLGLQPAAIGHSFGTLCIGRALQWTPELILPRIVTFGSILPCEFPWGRLLELGQVGRILNETCQQDPWPRRAPLFISDSGTSGCDGFPAEPFIDQREYDWTDHSRLATEMHCRRVWIPFITG